jgi:hypothetical protein
MDGHVASGLLALLAVCLHCGFQPRDSAGGHAMAALAVVVAAGAFGRWLYAFVPRSQNGRQADLEEVTAQVAALSGEWDRAGTGFGGEVRRSIEALASAEHWRRGFVPRLWGLLRSQWRLRAGLRALRARGRSEQVPAHEIEHVLQLARRAHRLALQIAHFDEVRAVLSTWRWLHRWLALLLVLLTALHVAVALRYGGVDFAVLWGGGRR